MARGHTHFVGIGGAGMSALAALLLDQGVPVSGCDVAPNLQTAELERRGARVFPGHDPAHLEGAGRVVFTGPAGSTGEVARARELGLPVLRRAELLGRLMDARRGAAVAGTHGKTTTTALLAAMLLASGSDPSALVGGVPAGWTFGGRGGSGPWLVAEADEYDRSFLTLHPEVAVLTGIDMDHPDIYRDVEDLEHSFERFLGGMAPGGRVFACASSARGAAAARRAGERTGLTVRTYGLDERADWRARITERANGRTVFDVAHPDGTISSLATTLPGAYNLENATGAVAAALACGGTEEGVRDGLARFRGVARRFELKGAAGGAVVVDDYAHHPAAIESVIAAARGLYPGREVWAAFQPHTYSRTRTLMPEFAAALRLADRAYVLDVYAAREAPDPEGSGEKLAALVGGRSAYVGGVPEAADRLAAELRPGVVLLALGAGDVSALGPRLLALLAERERPS